MTKVVVVPLDELEQTLERVVDKVLAGRGAKPEPLLLKRKQLAARFGVSLATIDRWKKLGMPTKPGHRFVFADCKAWHEQNITD